MKGKLSRLTSSGVSVTRGSSSRVRVHARSLAVLGTAVITTGGMLVSAAAANASPQPGLDRSTLYVTPSGRGHQCSVVDPCGLAQAQEKVRSESANMSSNITVLLGEGVYRLTAPLTFTEQDGDSGTNGHSVIYRATRRGSAVLSGAEQITSWQPAPGSPDIWRSYVGGQVNSRELYVNGVRQTRARTEAGLSGVTTQTSTGYVTSDPRARAWVGASGIEFVYRITYQEQRCPVASVTADGADTEITMAQPCYALATNPSRTGGKATDVRLPTWIENAPMTLDSPGEWQLAGGWLSYWPPQGTSLRHADVELPTLQQILSVSGTTDQHVHDISFDGLTFAYATWLGPNEPSGFSEVQANTTWTGGGPPTVSAANVTVSAADDVVFRDDTFEHLGGAAVSVLGGSDHVEVVDSRIVDVSGNGAVFGDWSSPNPQSGEQNVNDIFSGNVVDKVGQEYHGAVGFFGGYLRSMTVSHNSFVDLPYTGISLVSWPSATPSYAGGSTIEDNLVYDSLNVMLDGDGIYTIGDLGGAQIAGNYVNRVSGPPAGIRLDTKSAHITVTDNVVRNAQENWLMVQTNKNYPGAAVDNVITHNYSDNASMNMVNGVFNGPIDPSNVITDNDVGLTSFPVPARLIMASAGARRAGEGPST